MTKSQTVWSSSSKNADAWAVAARNSTAWNNEVTFPASYTYSDGSLTYSSATRTYNYVSAVPADQLNNRNPTTWTGATRNAVSWSNESQPIVGYTYDSSVTYDSSHTYDYTIMVTNQSNNKNATVWAVVI